MTEGIEEDSLGPASDCRFRLFSLANSPSSDSQVGVRRWSTGDQAIYGIACLPRREPRVYAL